MPPFASARRVGGTAAGVAGGFFELFEGGVLQAKFFLPRPDFSLTLARSLRASLRLREIFSIFKAEFLHRLKGALGGGKERFVAFEVAAGDVNQNLSGRLDGQGVLLFCR